MMIKYAKSSGSDLIEVVEPGVKLASDNMSAARQFISRLEPDPKYTYALVNAMGYSEFYGANSNTDWYGYNPPLDFNGLLHAWDGIGNDIEVDRMRAKQWTFGYPTFYGATCFAHHKNTDAEKLGFGDVIFAAANPHMKRLELVMRVFNEEAQKKGHTNFLDRLRAGERVDVSQGCKVPFDLCVRPETLVRGENGWKPAGAVQVGESLLTHRGRFRKVTRTFRRLAKDPLLCIKARGVPALEVTGTHPMFVVRHEQLRTCKGSANGSRRRCTPAEGVCTFCDREVSLTPEWVDAKDLRVGDYLVAPREELGTTDVDVRRARLLGYWLGDGHRVRQRTGKKKDGDYRLMGYALTVGHVEDRYLARLLECIEDVSENEPRVYESGEGRAAYQVVVSDQATAQWLCQLGADTEYNKRIAEEVFSWKREALLELLGGWIDTDGSFDTASGLVRVSTVSRGLALDCQRILRLLGVPAVITSAKTSSEYSYPSTHDYYYYNIAITRHHVHRLELWDRAEKVSQVGACAQGTTTLIVGDCVLHPVFSLRESNYEGDVVNFSVEEDESYVAEGVSTHNCSICTDWSAIQKAWSRFSPQRHLHQGLAILEYHRTVHPIRGLAITSKDYCEHMKLSRGKTLPNGEKVFVYNDFPRFFDISFVWVGADRTARAMWFLSPEGSSVSNSVRNNGTSIDHLFSRFFANRPKLASLEKRVPDGFAETVQQEADAAPGIDGKTLRAMTLAEGPNNLLSSLAALGIVLRPEEFQNVALSTDGRGAELAEQFEKRSLVFSEVPGVSDRLKVSSSHSSYGLIHKLAGLAPSRSGYDPFLGGRLKRAGQVRPDVLGVELPKLASVSQEYNGYRLGLLESAEELHGQGVLSLPDSMLKLSSIGPLGTGLLLGLGPVLHFLSAHLRSKKPEELGGVAKFVANNPTFTTLVTIGALLRTAMAVNKAGGFGSVVRSFGQVALKAL